MYMLIVSGVTSWNRIIEINDEKIYNYFKLRLCNFLCYIEKTYDFRDLVDCSIHLKAEDVSLTDKNNVIYDGLNLSSCYALVCVKYINMKKERNHPLGWGIHAGGFMYNGDLCVLVGATHAGKSTTVFNLISNTEFKYINDDIVLFDSYSLELIPFAKPIQMRSKIESADTNNYFVDHFFDNHINVSVISLPYLNQISRIKYKKIRMFLLVRDARKELGISIIKEKQKYVSLMTNCYNKCIDKNMKNIMTLFNLISGYQIVFPDGTDVANVIMSLL